MASTRDHPFGPYCPTCRVQGVGCRELGSGCRVQGVGFRVQGACFRVQGIKVTIQRRLNAIRDHRLGSYGPTCNSPGDGHSCRANLPTGVAD